MRKRREAGHKKKKNKQEQLVRRERRPYAVSRKLKLRLCLNICSFQNFLQQFIE